MTLMFGAVGAAIGSLIPGVGTALGFSIGSMVGGYLEYSNQTFQGGRLQDTQVTGSGWGAMIPWCFGDAPVSGNLVWAGTFTEHQDEHSAGGGCGGGPSVTEYSYSCSLLMLVCKAGPAGVRKIWGEDVLIYDSEATPHSSATIRVHLGGEEQDPDPFIEALEGAGHVPAYRGQLTVMFEELDLSPWGNRIPQMTFEVYDSALPTTGEILSAIADECGLDSGDRDFSDATDEVRGYVVGRRASGRDIAHPILAAFALDLCEADGKVKAVPRGGTATELAAGDLAAKLFDGEDVPAASFARTPDLELPGRLDFGYISVSKPKEQGVRASARFGKDLENSATMATTLVLPDDVAQEIADRLLYQAWAERDPTTIALGPKHLAILPTDPIIVPTVGGPVRMRVVRVDEDPLGIRHATAVRDVPISLTGDMSGGGGSGGSTGTVGANFRAWSGVPLREADGLHPGFYVAATGPSGWTGCTIFYSPDGGTTWLDAGKITKRSAIGTAETVFGDAGAIEVVVPPLPWDPDPTATHLTVALEDRGSLSSCSTDEALFGVNTAVIGAEVFSFAQANPLTGDRRYELTWLVRGRKSSPYTGHGVAEVFAVVGDGTARVTVANGLIGTTVLVKCVSANETIYDVVAQSVVIAPNVRPYADADTGSWARRFMVMS